MMFQIYLIFFDLGNTKKGHLAGCLEQKVPKMTKKHHKSTNMTFIDCSESSEAM